MTKATDALRLDQLLCFSVCSTSLAMTQAGRASRERGLEVNQAFARARGLSTQALADLRTRLHDARAHLQKDGS